MTPSFSPQSGPVAGCCKGCGNYLNRHCGSSTCPWMTCPRCRVYGKGETWAELPEPRELKPDDQPKPGPEPA